MPCTHVPTACLQSVIPVEILELVTIFPFTLLWPPPSAFHRFLDTSCKDLSFRVRPLSLGFAGLSVSCAGPCFFLRVAEPASLCGRATFCLCVHLWMDTGVVGAFGCSGCCCSPCAPTRSCLDLFPVPWGVSPEVELLGPGATVFGFMREHPAVPTAGDPSQFMGLACPLCPLSLLLGPALGPGKWPWVGCLGF